MRTDGHDEANRRFSQFCEKRLKIEVLFIYFWGYLEFFAVFQSFVFLSLFGTEPWLGNVDIKP